MRNYILSLICLLLASTAFAAGPKDVPSLAQRYDAAMASADYLTAYTCMAQIEQIYRDSKESAQTKLTKQGYGRTYIAAGLERVGEQALTEADKVGTNEAYARFLSVFKRVPKRLRTEAQTLQRLSPAWQYEAERTALAQQWLSDHWMITSTANLRDLESFRTNRSYRLHPDLKAKDDSLLALTSIADTAAVIRLAAPYRLAFILLQKQLRPALLAADYAAAEAIARSYADAFVGDHDYLDLLRVLSEAQHTADTLSMQALFADYQPDGQMYSPVISADDRYLYFCGRDLQSDREPGQEDVFVSAREGNGWRMPALIGSLSAQHTNEAIESVSTDGTQVFLFINGQTFVTRKEATGWSRPTPWAATLHQSSRWISDVHLTADGRAAFFSMLVLHPVTQRENTDIFCMTLQPDGRWSAPFSLGDSINTPFEDRMPFLHPDGRTLYFTSEGHSSLGGFDLFRCRRLDMSSFAEWSRPVNLGTLVNTPGDEAFYSVNTAGTRVYLTSGERNHLRLFEIVLPEAMRPDPVATLAGHVHTADGAPLSADVRWEDLTSGESLGLAHSDPSDGSFFVTLPVGHLYGYYVDEQDYLPSSDNVDLRAVSESISATADITLTSLASFIAANRSMEIHNLFFALDKADILPESLPELRRLAELIRRAGCRVEISGHADNSGTAKHNLALSQARADAVRLFFISEGCDAALLTAVGYGDTRPLESNDTDSGRQRNRRVEISFQR